MVRSKCWSAVGLVGYCWCGLEWVQCVVYGRLWAVGNKKLGVALPSVIVIRSLIPQALQGQRI
jgi:hypothetical protein